MTLGSSARRAMQGGISLKKGDIFLDTYRIVGRIGRGGMGVVYGAVEQLLKRDVAIKFVLDPTEELVARFKRESQILAAIEHPSIVRVLTAGITAEGLPYLVMPLLKGQTLRRVIEDGLRLPWDLVVHIGIQIADALTITHDHGILHRDIKPENIVLGAKGRAWLLDFGLAKKVRRQDDDDDAPRPPGHASTDKNKMAGTPRYAAPEVISGADAGEGADLYALGITFYEALSGRHPMRRLDQSGVTVVEAFAAHLHDAPTPVEPGEWDVPAELWAIVFRLLEKDPTQRGGRMEDVANALRAVLRVSVPAGDAIDEAMAHHKLEKRREKDCAHVTVAGDEMGVADGAPRAPQLTVEIPAMAQIQAASRRAVVTARSELGRTGITHHSGVHSRTDRVAWLPGSARAAVAEMMASTPADGPTRIELPPAAPAPAAPAPTAPPPTAPPPRLPDDAAVLGPSSPTPRPVADDATASSARQTRGLVATALGIGLALALALSAIAVLWAETKRAEATEDAAPTAPPGSSPHDAPSAPAASASEAPGAAGPSAPSSSAAEPPAARAPSPPTTASHASTAAPAAPAAPASRAAPESSRAATPATPPATPATPPATPPARAAPERPQPIIF